MKIKLDEAGAVILQDGKPIYVADDGKEFPLDGGHLYGRVTELTKENTSHRTRFTDAETKLKAFEGITDPAAALKAIETLANIDSGSLIAAGKVDEIKTAARQAAEATIADAMKASKVQIAELEATAAKLQNDLYGERIGGSFTRSRYIADKIAVPVDMVQAMFGSAFKSEEGKTVAYYPSGEKIFSRARPGEVADFEEAMEALVSAYPFKDSILKGEMKAGGGAQNPGAGGGGNKTMTRAAFEALSAHERSDKMKAGYQLTEN